MARDHRTHLERRLIINLSLGSSAPEHNEIAMPQPKPVRPSLLPRLVRFRDAPHYLGMDRNRFNIEVRPLVTEVRIGTQGIAFDRLELDAWVDDYLARNGRPARKGDNLWDVRKCPASSCGPGTGMSTNASAGGEFAKALEQLTFKKRNDTSRE